MPQLARSGPTPLLEVFQAVLSRLVDAAGALEQDAGDVAVSILIDERVAALLNFGLEVVLELPLLLVVQRLQAAEDLAQQSELLLALLASSQLDE